MTIERLKELNDKVPSDSLEYLFTREEVELMHLSRKMMPDLLELYDAAKWCVANSKGPIVSFSPRLDAILKKLQALAEIEDVFGSKHES